ncbi:MAG: diguanylate cyclase [Acidimicrobiales bacterium]|nr:diguanylate cyclase [Acidimicrobiales bacterium]
MTLATAPTLFPAPAPDEGTTSPSVTLDGLPGSFSLYYQPELDLASRTVTGCEALVRWHHPTFGTLRPGPALSDSRWASRLAELEEWAILAACRQSAAWERDGTPLRVALNVSIPLLSEGRFLEILTTALAWSGAQPDLLAIDVAMAGFSRYSAGLVATLEALDAAGVAIIIDGVSGDTLRPALVDVPVSACKIPLYVSMCRRPGLHPSVAAALALARDLGATTVAKAVETSEELDEVSALGFDRAFGHLFSPALPPADFAALYRHSPVRLLHRAALNAVR